MVKALSARVFIKVLEVCWSLVLIPPNGFPFVFGCVFSTFVILLLVSHLPCKRGGRDGSYPHSRSPQVIFLPLTETLPFSRVCRCSSPSSAVQKSLGNGHWHQVFSPVPEDDREDFVFPGPGPLEWMLRGQEATADQVWVPPLFGISDLKIQRGDMQPVPIDFEFPCSAAADWFHWVAEEFLDVKFCALLERAGVAEAILLSLLSWSCNMYRDTEMLRQILRRWCTSTHTFFFLWGELTITLEDVENHWLLPVLGDMDPFAVEMSEEETLVEQALMARSSTRINAWSLYFAKGTEPAVRRAAFVHVLDFTFLWERSLNYQEVGNDNGQIREKFRNMSHHILSRYPDLKNNLPLVYRWVSLRGKDPDLVPSLDFEECIVWRPYSYRYAGFSCHSVLYWFSDIASQSFELFPDDTRSLTYLSAGVPGSPSETLPRTPSIAPFLNDRAFDYWSQSVSRMVIPCGGRLGICTVAMQEYWLRVVVAMADYVNQGRGTRVPLSNHHAHPVETMTLSPPTQTAISYADRQNLGFAEWDGSRDGWILYSTKFPSGWKESVKVVEERLRLDSKRGKGGKKIDSSKGDSSPAASKQKPKSAAKTTSKRPKVAMDMSMIPPSELGGRSLMAPGTSKKSAVGTSKSQKKPAVGSLVNPTEDTSIPSKETESSASTAAPPSSGEESPVESATPIEKESAVPTPPSTMYGRTRSKRKAAEEQVKSQAKRKVGDEAEGSDWTPIVIEEVSGDDDIVDAGVGTTEVNEGIVERQEVALEMRPFLFMADEAVQSTTSIMAEEVPGEIPVSMADVVRVDEAHEIAPVMADETLVGSAAKDDHDQDIDSVDSEETVSDKPQPLQIIPFADQRDEPRTIDPIEFHSNPPFARMASVMEGISLFGVAPRFERIFREESSPMVVSDRPSSGIFIGGQVPALEGTPIQDADDGGMADTEVRGVDVVPEDVETPVPVEKESVAHVVSAAASSSQTQSAVEVITPGRVAAFFARFEERAPNPYPDWHFWKFEGPLVAYGNFWVYQDAVPLLQGLTAKFGDFTTHFKFGAGFGGPMLSLLGSVLADMRRTSFKTLSEPKILSWRSVVQDLIAVGFDLDFMLEHLRKVARKFFGEAIASEMKIVQEQISSLQSTLAVLVSYQGELMSAAAASPEVVEVASPIDGLFD
uniref:Aminotransferase-like plant mobile domain-containing protein n=1 Tax=Fagus sylvatica TaxID=28930 RepID=A0A2N9GAC1_FAGSY